MYEQEDFHNLPQRLQPKSLDEALNPFLKNVRRMYREQKIKNLPLEVRPKEYLPPECPTCHDTRTLRVESPGYQTQYVNCPDCKEQARAEQRARINRRWPLGEWEVSLANMPWLDDRPNAPNAPQARAAQQEIIRHMPSSMTLLLYGKPGTGKSRLLTEIAVQAKDKGLASIYRSADYLRSILVIPYGVDGEERTRLETRKALAWGDLLTADVLLIDEIDHTSGERIGDVFLELLNARIADRLTTCMAGNNVLSKLPAPIVSRMHARGNLFVNLGSDSDARTFLGHGPQEE